MSAYLFAYFVGNEPNKERIHFAVSRDGYNFTALNNNEAVITQTLGKKCVRDPYIFKGQDEYYYIIGTDMKCTEGWESNHALIVWRSRNLVDWTDETLIDIALQGENFKNTTRAWAPQVMWDEKEQMYMIYWAHSTKDHNIAGHYYAHTADFKTITEPQPLYCRDGIQTIDGDIIYNEMEKLYYLYFKHDEDQTIAYVTSENLTGPYKDEPVVVSLAPSGVEGSEMYQLDSSEWLMIMDEYGKGRFFMQRTTDFKHFEAVPRNEYSMEFSPRHGSVVRISDDEYEHLVMHNWLTNK